MTAPCKNCEFREMGCHAKCPDYQKFDRERNEYRESVYQKHIDTFGRYDRQRAFERTKGSYNRHAVYKTHKK